MFLSFQSKYPPMRYLLILFLFMLSFRASALSDSTTVVKKKKAQHQLFLNTTFFLKQIISLSNQNIAISPYIVGYKCFFKNHGLRAAVGGSFSKKTEFPDTSSTRVTGNNIIDYRVGYEYRHFFGKRWNLSTGVDMVGRSTFGKVKANSVFDIVTTSTPSNSLGAGPFAGIQFNISKHIALFTEVAFYYSYTWTQRKVNSVNFPEQNVNRRDATEYKGEFILPTSIYFAFIF
jgi:hypothetical protein